MPSAINELLKEKNPRINPDVVITFGADGDTHHSEHIVVGGVVTELLLAEGWVEKYPLYYFAWKKGRVDVDDLGFTNERYFNVQINYSQEDENKALETFRCYVTQYTVREFDEESERKLQDKINTLYFRKFVVMKRLKNEF